MVLLLHILQLMVYSHSLRLYGARLTSIMYHVLVMLTRWTVLVLTFMRQYSRWETFLVLILSLFRFLSAQRRTSRVLLTSSRWRLSCGMMRQWVLSMTSRKSQLISLMRLLSGARSYSRVQPTLTMSWWRCTLRVRIFLRIRLLQHSVRVVSQWNVVQCSLVLLTRIRVFRLFSIMFVLSCLLHWIHQLSLV